MNFTPSKNERELFSAIVSLQTEDECRKFMRDLLTEAEIKEFANRWKVAQLLFEKVNYKAIEKETGMSSTTIARISKWLENGMGGYQLMVKRVKNNMKTVHHTPLPAE